MKRILIALAISAAPLCAQQLLGPVYTPTYCVNSGCGANGGQIPAASTANARTEYTVSDYATSCVPGTGGGGTTTAICRVKDDGSGYVLVGGAASSSLWSGITNPTGNLALTMGANTSAFTYNATTGVSNLFTLADTASNTGTGYMLNLVPALGSAIKPFHIGDNSGNDSVIVAANGNVGIRAAPDVNYGLAAGGYWGQIFTSVESTLVLGSHNISGDGDGSDFYQDANVNHAMGTNAYPYWNALFSGGITNLTNHPVTVAASGSSYGRVQIRPDTFTAASAYTIPTAASLWITAAPANGTNVTVTNPYALYIAAGNSYLGGNVGIGTTSPGAGLDVASNAAITFRAYNTTPTTGSTRALISLGAADSASTVTLTNAGTTKSAGYQSSDGSAGVSGATCTAWKNGLCTSL